MVEFNFNFLWFVLLKYNHLFSFVSVDVGTKDILIKSRYDDGTVIIRSYYKVYIAKIYFYSALIIYEIMWIFAKCFQLLNLKYFIHEHK